MRSIAKLSAFPRFLLGFILFVSFQCAVHADENSVQTLRVRADINLPQLFIRDALELALSKIERSYKLQDTDTSGLVSELRHIKLIQEDKIDIYWQTTSAELEKALLPIRIPILRGLMGYRILVIPKDSQAAYRKVTHLDDLKALNFGQGKNWPDVTILRANGLKVTTAPHFANLYPMIKIGRFDALPRGLHQVWYEVSWIKGDVPTNPTVEKKAQIELTVEKHIVLKYVSPMYFFVSRDRPKLAKHIEKGLRIAIEDGSYDSLFFSNAKIREAIIKSDLKNRTIIQLENPMQPPETPIEEKALWFDPEQDIPELRGFKTIAE